MKSHTETSVMQLPFYRCLLMNTAPPRDQPSWGIKSFWSIKHKVDRKNILKAIFIIRNTVKYSHENILNQAKLHSSTNKLNKGQ